ncbi:MAG: hypothetical protein COW88_01185 [Candidatus Lloydbacteria bacterium CG22_combo_CG10-13_8_21_14_all_47_15]|uniref:Uncharacterized protein n=1 Tax=Candidatus Lloydbacteria bacterium CG22_combo_CG10-13_8_21_14_all_47_15 TaxID=1974635 RepID=A0A2H0CVD2_9BACT|nr:MAG: hypothetical protein COW88_01185 [Candidatus Lloydbacteria bacterium CG22_combo_CG10-13_8_21_14_all_47_15]
MESKIITEKISKDELRNILKENFGTMAKVDVDVKRHILTIGGEWHSEGEDLLIKDGSSREDAWGVNFHPLNIPEKRIEYVSLINIKPVLKHTTMEITDNALKQKISSVIASLLLSDNENL